MLAGFEGAGGTVTGRDHALLGRNNQDAWAWWSDGEVLLAVVADGCGSGQASEIGAGLGVRLVVDALRRRAERFGGEAAALVLEEVRLSVLRHLHRLAVAMGGREDGVVGECLLFTLLGLVVTTEVSVVFGLGDGAFGVNGRHTVLASADNAPAYLGYALRDGSEAPQWRFAIHTLRPTREVDSLMVATDGLSEILDEERVAKLLSDEEVLRNPAGLGRRLRLLARPTQRIDWAARRVEGEPGLVRDDATVVLVRRRRT